MTPVCTCERGPLLCYNVAMDRSPTKTSKPITGAARQHAADRLNASVADVTLQSVSGGYSKARRSLVGYGGKWVFVKQVDPDLLKDEEKLAREIAWQRKDYDCVLFLQRAAPHLGAEWAWLSDDGLTMMTTAYRPDDGWLWQLPELPGLRPGYITAVLGVLEQLEGIQLDDETIDRLGLEPILRDQLAFDGGLEELLASNEMRQALFERHQRLALEAEATSMRNNHRRMMQFLSNQSQIASLAEHAKLLHQQPQNYFSHGDVRSENITLNPSKSSVRLVDWNWASLTPKGFSATEFLLDVARNQIDVTPWLSSLNRDLLAAVVGFYAKHGLESDVRPTSRLRLMQAQVAATALKLYEDMKVTGH